MSHESDEGEDGDPSNVIYFPGATPNVEQLTPGLGELQARRESLITATRTFVKDQVGLWRQIPFLALEADLRMDAPHQSHTAYSMGHWHFDNGKEPGDEDYNGDTCVDLETGELLTNMPPQYIGVGKRHFYRELGFQPTPDSEVLRLLELPEQLLAENIIEMLRRAGQNPIVDTLDEAKVAELKERVRRRDSITPLFTRKK